MTGLPEQLYYDRQGRPITQTRWAELMMSKHQARLTAADNGWSSPEGDPTRIGLDRVGDITVSTVWLGIDHNWWGRPPLIFETMVFGGPDNEEMERYCTEAEALAGHQCWVARQRLWEWQP